MPTDYYQALGVDPEAGADDIKRAFRSLAREHHPDATGGDATSEQRYKEISEAYAVLSDPEKRRQYDAARMGVGSWESPWASPFSSTIEDIFETFFGGGVGVRERTRQGRGGAIEVVLTVSLDQVVFGGQATLTFDRFETCADCQGSGCAPGTEPERCSDCGGAGQVQQARRTVLGSLVTAHPCPRCRAEGWVVSDPCPTCRGDGRTEAEASIDIEIPTGIGDEDRLRVTGEGEAGRAGGPTGDLHVRFQVEPDHRFERLGDDLFAWVRVPATIAALGGSVEVETLDGARRIDIDADTATGTMHRVRKLGVPRRAGRGRGDLVLRVEVLPPAAADEEQRRLLDELAKLRKENGTPTAELRNSLSQ